MPELFSNLLAALPYLEWLLDPDTRSRRSGRTVALAIAAIRVACRNPGQRVSVIDHFHTRVANRNLRDMIAELVHRDPAIAGHVSIDTNSFLIALPRPIDDWLPFGWTKPTTMAQHKPAISRWNRILEAAQEED